MVHAWVIMAASKDLLTHSSYNDGLFFSKVLLVMMFYHSDREVPNTPFEKKD